MGMPVPEERDRPGVSPDDDPPHTPIAPRKGVCLKLGPHQASVLLPNRIISVAMASCAANPSPKMRDGAFGKSWDSGQCQAMARCRCESAYMQDFQRLRSENQHTEYHAGYIRTACARPRIPKMPKPPNPHLGRNAPRPRRVRTRIERRIRILRRTPTANRPRPSRHRRMVYQASSRKRLPTRRGTRQSPHSPCVRQVPEESTMHSAYVRSVPERTQPARACFISIFDMKRAKFQRHLPHTGAMYLRRQPNPPHTTGIHSTTVEIEMDSGMALAGRIPTRPWKTAPYRPSPAGPRNPTQPHPHPARLQRPRYTVAHAYSL